MNQQVPFPHTGNEICQEAVKLCRRRCIARHIPAVTIQHIKVHQVYKGQALKIPGLQCLGKSNAVGVAGGLDLFGHALAVEDIKDLAHSDHIFASVFQHVQHGGTRGLKAQVVAVGGAVEGICQSPRNGRAITRPTPNSPFSISRAISQYWYSCCTGTSSSWAATWNTLSALV